MKQLPTSLFNTNNILKDSEVVAFAWSLLLNYPPCILLVSFVSLSRHLSNLLDNFLALSTNLVCGKHFGYSGEIISGLRVRA